MSLQLTVATEQRWQKILDAYPEGRKRSAVIPMLIFAQDETGIITRELMEEIARRAEVPYLQVEEVVGFYSMLRKQPLGRSSRS